MAGAAAPVNCRPLVRAAACLLLILGGPRFQAGVGPSPAVADAGGPGSKLADGVAGSVRWQAWGADALLRARREGKPIFLSVGYPACHWCEAMDQEVFADSAVAALLNAAFVSIRVDRETRPDVDRIYMTATQLLCGQAGWPNSVFLTPDLQPFYAGTYFPLHDTVDERGFATVLDEMLDAWNLRRAEVLKVAGRVSAAIAVRESGRQAPAMAPDTVLVERALSLVEGRFDPEHGGFGTAPKFPPDVWLGFVMASPERCRAPRYWRLVTGTLDGMARGALRDPVGGGFLRYCTDAAWRAPQFEMVLPTQAAVAGMYLTALAVEDRPLWRGAVDGVLDFVRDELTDSQGGLHTALHAANQTAEVDAYCWSDEELRGVLGSAADSLLMVFGLETAPCGDAGGALYRRQQALLPAEAATAELPASSAWRPLQLLAALREDRGRRVRLERDPKVVTAWHAMMLQAYVQAYQLYQRPAHLEAALRAAAFAENRLRLPSGALARYSLHGVAGGHAFLEDFAYLARAYVALAEATGDRRWLRRAQALGAGMVAGFWDSAGGGFYLEPAGAGVLVRARNAQDDALPSANAVAVHALLDLGEATGDRTYMDQAAAALAAFGGMMRARPDVHVHLVAAAERYLRRAATANQGSPAP